MIDLFTRRLGPIHTGWAIAAGWLGALAYLVEQSIDLAVFKNGSDDMKLLGMVVTKRPPLWQVLGYSVHFAFGSALAVVYAMTAGRWLLLAPWLSGLVFTQFENLILGSLLLPAADRWHPAVRGGQIPPYLRPVPILQQILRHAAYGAVLGWVYGEVGRKQHR
ncbi:MAG: hypothetical protein U0556_14840 [Dehalococcoidia bacterium]